MPNPATDDVQTIEAEIATLRKRAIVVDDSDYHTERMRVVRALQKVRIRAWSAGVVYALTFAESEQLDALESRLVAARRDVPRATPSDETHVVRVWQAVA